ncbi:AzlC family ABC transporter permease [Deinococcus sp. HMF7604]|uniref:AzlC family ABC transporter permease n=1 Tax=Deinococcus betulae TaxID=2873312 RepID=UPI001CCB0BD4|nr:AzlC family ABC transporter permease [Deinococcus betulae]MBZ9752277.1 AzlC family ABC transporter permease [Deinococcus betulae]
MTTSTFPAGAPFPVLTPRAALRQGVRAMSPFLVSAFPMGLIAGAFGVTSGLHPLETFGLAALTNSGTVQFIGIALLRDGSTVTAILLTSLIVSLRMLIYAVMLRPHTQGLSPRWRALLAFGLIDAVFFTVMERFKTPEGQQPSWPWFFVGASSVMYVNWLAATVVGMLIGEALPDLIKHGLDFPMTAIFAAMLASTLGHWRAWTAAATGGLVALLTHTLPYNLGLIAGILVGALVGVLCEQIEQRRAHGGTP